MGFGFNLFAAFILFPLTIILLVIWLISRKLRFGKLLLLIWFPVLGLILLSVVVRFFTEKKQLDRNDIYGDYVIDRTIFAGDQANWQYNHFRFTIKKDNTISFYCTEKDKIMKTFTGAISFVEGYSQPRIVLHITEPRHHILDNIPTLYRKTFSFYYVFHSPKFGNVFFTKGEWKEID